MLRRCLVAFALAALASPAMAASLTVLKVSAPAVNCVFDASCTITVNDSTGNLNFSALGNSAFLQSRVFTAKPGTPAAGLTGFLYRIDLRQGTKFTECQAGLVLNAGPVAKLAYAANKQAHIFVITQGGLGSVGIASAEQNGDVITFAFDKYLCNGSSTFFFGFAAAKGPVNSQAVLYGMGSPPMVQIAARTPQH